jgi:autotransporter-associated beta strand protein
MHIRRRRLRRLRLCLCLPLALACAGLPPPAASAQTVTNFLTTADATGTHSFAPGGVHHWTDGLDPHEGADYVVSGTLHLRSPENSSAYTFLGDSLAFLNNAPNGGFNLKGGNSRLTITNLFLGPGSRIWMGVNGVVTLTVTGRVDGTASDPSRFYAIGGRTLTLNGALLGSGCFSFSENNTENQTGTGLLNLNADLSAYEGTWQVQNPVRANFSRSFDIRLSQDNNIGSALPTFTPDAIRLINGGALSGNGTSVTVSNHLNRGITLVNDGTFSGVNISHRLTIATPVTGTGDLYKQGVNIVVLEAPLTHDSGNIYLENGTLRLGAACVLPANSTITVRGASTRNLEGVGDFGDVVLESGHLSPGFDAIATNITVRTLTFNGGALSMDLGNANTSDFIQVAHALVKPIAAPIRVTHMDATRVPSSGINEYRLLSAPNLAADFTAADFQNDFTARLPAGHFEIRTPGAGDPELFFVQDHELIRLLSDDSDADNSWQSAKQHWSDARPVHADADYFVTDRLMRTGTPTAVPAFGGHSLSIHGSGDLRTKIPALAIPDLRLFGGQISHGGTANNQTLDGAITVYAADSAPFRFVSEGNSALERTLTIRASISGSGALAFAPYPTTTAAHAGGYYIASTNDAFSGKITLNGVKTLELGIWDERNLGGLPPDAPFVADHLTLASNATLRAMSSLVLDDPWRGIRINGAGGKFQVAAGDTLTLATPVSGTALAKTGAGHLILAGSNTLSSVTVAEGSLTVAHIHGLGTNAVSFASGTTLRIPFPGILPQGFLIPPAATLAGPATLSIAHESTLPAHFDIPLFFLQSPDDPFVAGLTLTGVPASYALTWQTSPVIFNGIPHTLITLSGTRRGMLLKIQ